MRFVALLDLTAPEAVRRRLAAVPGLSLILDAEDICVFADNTLPRTALDDGVLLGDLFVRGQDQPVETLGPSRCESIRVSEGRSLIETCWGSYVAIWREPISGSGFVLRSPLGRLPAYYSACGGGMLMASDAALLAIATDARPGIDWTELACRIGQADLRRERTCLAGIVELRGGDRLRMRRGTIETETLWAPWSVLDGPALDEKEEAAARLRDSVRLSVRASVARHRRTVLQLSGGVDSSIVAACLAQAGHDFSCLNFRMRGRGGDEADHAKAVAVHMGAQLRIAEPDAELVDLEHSAARTMPFPARRGFEQAMDALGREQAAAVGATAILDGGGGDNVFFAMLSITPAAEMLLHHGFGPRFRELVAALSDLTGTSRLRLTWKALRCARRGRARAKPPFMLPFLSGDAQALVRTVVPHPWLDAPVGPYPAKAAMIAGLAPAQCLVEGRDPLADLPQISVLLTQPLIATCVRVDSRLWFAPGQTRALARHAFATELPAVTLARRSKGTPDGFVAALFLQRRPQIRGMLLDGLLAKNGLLNRAAVAHVLDARTPVANTDFVRMMELVDAEAWARCWA